MPARLTECGSGESVVACKHEVAWKRSVVAATEAPSAAASSAAMSIVNNNGKQCAKQCNNATMQQVASGKSKRINKMAVNKSEKVTVQ